MLSKTVSLIRKVVMIDDKEGRMKGEKEKKVIEV